MNLYLIPADFINEKVNLSWCDIKWGYEKNLLTSEIPIKKQKILYQQGTILKLNLSCHSLFRVNQITSLLLLMNYVLTLKKMNMRTSVKNGYM